MKVGKSRGFLPRQQGGCEQMNSGELERLRHSMKPAFLWDVGRHRLVWANTAAVRFFRAHSLTELVERPFDSREAGVQALARAARDLVAGAAKEAGATPEREVELLFPSVGRDEPLRARVRPHLLADGRPGLLVVAADAGAAHMTPPEVLSEILDEMPQPVIALESSGALAYANPAALELMDESGLAALSGIFPTRTAALDFLARAREAGTAVITREANTNIGRRTLRLVARAAHDGDLVIIMMDDLTDRLAAERMELPLAPAMPEERPSDGADGEDAGQGERPSAALRADELEALRRLVEELSPGSAASAEAEEETSAAETTGVPPAGPTGIAEEPGVKSASEPSAGIATSPPESSARITIRVRPTAEVPTASPAPDKPAADNESAEEEYAGEPEQEAVASPRVSVRISGARKKEPAAEESPGKQKAAGADETPAPEEPTPPAEPAAEGKAGTVAEAQPAPEEIETPVAGEEAPAATAEAPPAVDTRAEAEGTPREQEGARPVSAEETRQSGAAGHSGTAAHPEREEHPRREETTRPERPEPPSLVREVLDHRPEPIILHRADAFYFANRAARELFGFAAEDTAWDDIARELAAAVEGEDVLLPDAGGTLHRFRLKRDVFPWRAGVVVQSTLLSAEADLPKGTVGSGRRRPGRAAPRNEDVTAGLEKLREQVQAVASRAPAPVIRIHAHTRRQSSRDDAGDQDTSARHPGQAPVAGVLPEAAPAPADTADAEEAPRQMPADEAATEDASLRAVLEAANEGIITLNERGEILSFSAGAAELFGLSAAEALGRPFRELLVEESRAALDARLSALREGAEDAAHARDRGREVSARRPDGEEVVLFMTVGMLQRRRLVADDHTARYCVLVRDITPFKRRERELEAAREEAERQSARKSEFLARISHELRTPLNAILGFSDVLRQELFGKLGNEKYLDYARDIHESGEHLLSLVNDLLDLARIEAGRFQVQFTEVDLAEVVHETTRLLRDQAQEAEIDLREVIPEDLPKVVADTRSVKQILLNLLSNAIKYGGKGGRVVVSLRQLPEGGLELSVKDDGPGMSEEELDRALEPFSRVERTGEGKPGTGLGLPLAKALAEANKARFEVESEPGRGTIARVVFPPHRVLA